MTGCSAPLLDISVSFSQWVDAWSEGRYAVAISSDNVPSANDAWVADQNGIYASTKSNPTNACPAAGIVTVNNGGTPVTVPVNLTVRMPTGFNGVVYLIVVSRSWSIGGCVPDAQGDYEVVPITLPCASFSPTRTPTPLPCSAPACSYQWTTFGDAYQIPGGVHLTSAAGFQNATAWSNFRLNFGTSFSIQYDMLFSQLGVPNDAGADGIAVIFQNDIRGLAALGDPGQGMGYADAVGPNLPVSPSIAVEIDTFQNIGVSGDLNWNDPANDHISIHRNGVGDENDAVNSPGAPVDAIAGGVNIEDGAYHRVRIDWNDVTNTFNIYFDGALRLTYTEDVVATLFGGQTCVYWGFGSATGGSVNVHEVLEVACMGSPTTTPTRTPFLSPTQTPIISPTRTPTRSVSVSPSPSRSPTRTISMTNTPGPTATPAFPLVKSSNISVGTIGQVVTYCLAWTNDSGSSQTMNIWDTVPTNISYSGCDNGCTIVGSLVRWNFSAGAGTNGSVCFWGPINSYPWLPAPEEGARWAALEPRRRQGLYFPLEPWL